MSRYLLDTTTLIDFAKGREPARSWLLAMIEGGEDLAVCAVNVAEFYAGVPPDKRTIWDEFFANLGYWSIAMPVASRAGQHCHDWARRGRPLTATDALVAAVAQQYDAILVTNNVRDFPMDDLQIVSL